jgi:hypothetical protein
MVEVVGTIALTHATRQDGRAVCAVVASLGAGATLTFYCPVGEEPPQGQRVQMRFTQDQDGAITGLDGWSR